MSDDKFAAPTKSDLESGTAMASITTDARPRSSAEHKLDDKEVHDLHVEVTEHAPTKKPRSFWFVLVSLMLGLFLATLDVTVVSTAIPTISRELNAVAEIPWIANGYLITCTALFPIWGKISEIFGHRETILFCITLFFLSSIMCGFAPNITVLIVGRSLQGIGGGALEALVAIVIAELVSPAERGKFQAMTGAVFGLSSLLGPLLGGIFSDVISWRWAFWINLPLCAFSFAGVWFNLKIQRPPSTFYSKLKHVDYLGVFTVLVGNVALLLACTWGGGEYAWNSAPVITCFVLAGVFWAAFIFVEIKVAKDPIMPIRLFTIRNSVTANFTNFCQGWITLGFVYYVPIYWQSVQGVSAMISGFRFIPAFMSTVTAVIISGIMTEKIGRAREFIIVGMFGLIVGCTIFGVLAKPDWDYWIVALIGVQLGLSLGLTLTNLLIVVQNSVPIEDLGPATSLAFFGRNLGGIFCITVVSAVIANVMPGMLEPKLAPLIAAGLPKDLIPVIAKYAAGGEIARFLKGIPQLPEQAVTMILTATSDSLNEAIKKGYISMVPIAAIGFLVALFIKHEPFKKDEAAMKLEQ